ncbi:MAG: hypothetical protein PHE26_05115 [Syntrophomonadaceae bacterium]|nr:hypothetical protein [Syntrophomonadaceae bacterium]
MAITSKASNSGTTDAINETVIYQKSGMGNSYPTITKELDLRLKPILKKQRKRSKVAHPDKLLIAKNILSGHYW